MNNPSMAPRSVIAIPARNEAARIGRCLAALAVQVDATGAPIRDFAIVLLINNTSDATRDVATRAAGDLGLKLECLELALAEDQATAGWARRAAMDAAAERAGPGGVILTTDADSRPQPGWLAANRRHLQSGVDAVAGEIDWDPEDPAPVFSENRQLEMRYAEQCAELTALLDPLPHDPWPNHRWAWGASLAVTVAAYRAAGGLPAVGLAEDRAFQALLLRGDFKVRHARDVRVWTSGRMEGRAPGGLADLIRTFATDETTLCDALLEPPDLVFRKAALRGRLRAAWAGQDHVAFARYAARASGGAICGPLAFETFGAAWEAIQGSSPLLAGERVHPQDLRRFSQRIGRLLGRLQTRRSTSIR